MSSLLLKPLKRTDGRVHAVTPESAGWTYVGFEVIDVPSGGLVGEGTDGFEVCLVLLSGRARVRAGGEDFGVIGGRSSPFEDDPYSVYVPAQNSWTLEAETAVELAVCKAPGSGTLPARLIAPDSVERITRGQGTNVRHVRNILPEGQPAEHLLVVEVITPGGHWSSYPPHKHDRDAFPEETLLEETYYHRFRPAQGFAFQRIYTDDRSLDETLTIEDRDVVLVPRGYHPVAAPHGYDLYYLNVMAGPKRAWRFHNDPAHEWMLKA